MNLIYKLLKITRLFYYTHLEKSAALRFSFDIIKAYLMTPVKLCCTIIFEALMKKVLFLEKKILVYLNPFSRREYSL